jgi:hypothetical protein
MIPDFDPGSDASGASNSHSVHSSEAEKVRLSTFYFTILFFFIIHSCLFFIILLISSLHFTAPTFVL